MSEEEARRVLSSPDRDRVEALRTVIRGFHLNKWLAVNEAADLAAMSVRSLQRELASRGVSFSQLVDDVRHELAIEMLKGKEVSLDAIASALGYSTTTNFARAFQRWTGVKISEFRSNNVDGPASCTNGNPRSRSER